MGVPSLGCHCRVCRSQDPHDNRTRPSLLLSRADRHAVIDTTPDFRFQALREKLDSLDGIVYTHGHADHILGFDDIRPYNLRQQGPIPIYANRETLDILHRAFSYVFDGRPAQSAIPSVTPHIIDGPFELLGVTWRPIPAEHGDMPVLGFRVGGLAYLTDFSRVPEQSMPLLADADELVMSALRDEPHPMHQTVAQALELVSQLHPRRVWFTHIAHDLPHDETNERLLRLGFPHVQLAYDGLSFEVAA